MRLLLGGSPCTHWSIAQTKHRETEPSGIGWELFENYLIARDKFAPDYFLYENNKSMSASIREEITRRLGVDPICINSALVSAQNRQRLYWANIPGVQQPEDKGILLRDILETGASLREKAYALLTPKGGTTAEDAFARRQRNVVAEPVNVSAWLDVNIIQPPPNDRVLAYAPSRYEYGDFNVCIMRGWQCTPNSTHGVTHWSPLPDAPMQEPCAGRMVGRRINENGHRDDYNESVPRVQRFELNENPQKTNCLSTVEKDNLVIQRADGKTLPVYEVRNGLITIKGKQYPIKLADGYYIIRKLTVRECMRLQTVPEWYAFPVSDTQAYKMLGNGWTVDVIAHILSYCPGITAEPLDVLSMYDGMACGHLALDKLGAYITRYRATEIDKYAIKTACHNFPDIEQLGDAYQVREWKEEPDNAT